MNFHHPSSQARKWSRNAACVLGWVLSLWQPADRAGAGTSQVLGHYPIQVPSGNSAWVAGLVCGDVFEGAATAVSADTDGKALITFDSPGWTTTQFPLHYAEPQSGTASGLAIDILSVTSNTLKVNATPAEAGLTVGMVFIVRKHVTLAGLLPTGGGMAPFSDSISLVTGPNIQETYYFHSGTQTWVDGLGGAAGNVVIRPGQGMIIQVGTARTLTIGSGEACFVKTTPTRVRVSAGVSNLVGPLNPLGTTTTLSALGIRSSLQAFNDSVVVLTPGSLTQSGTYLSNGSFFIGPTGQNANATPLPAGASVVVNVDAAKSVVVAPVTVAP